MHIDRILNQCTTTIRNLPEQIALYLDTCLYKVKCH